MYVANCKRSLYSENVLQLALLLPLVAFAADPQVSVDEGGHVVGTVVIPATQEQVRGVLDDPVQCAELSPDVYSVARVDRRDDCDELVTKTRGLFRPLRYRSRRCRTADGYRDRLVESEDFSAYETTWALREVDGGTEVTVRVHTEVNLPVPKSAVEKRSRKSVGEMLEALADKILRRRR
jgi:carbon monoxide dehydrogenase subunit G